MQHRHRPSRLSSPACWTAVWLTLPLVGACVDSSSDDGKGNPPPPDELVISPESWRARPAQIGVFEAFDPDFPDAPVVWDPPDETKVLWVEPNSIALVSTAQLGPFALQAASSQQPEVTGEASIEVVDFAFATELAQAYTGQAAMTPLGDVAVGKGTAPAPTGEVYVAYLNRDTNENVVRVYSPDLGTLLDEVGDLAFNLVQRPQVSADGAGNAYWVEQYFDPTLGVGGGKRVRQITRRQPGGALDVFTYDAAQFGGMQLCPGTDLAAGEDGLYLLASAGSACNLVRLEGLFGGAPELTMLGPVSAPAAQVKLALDREGRLLVAQLDVLSRWTPEPGGLGASIEVLGGLPAPAVALDTDGYGTIYVATSTAVLFLDVLGEEAYRLEELEITAGPTAALENLLGLGVDVGGDLRLLDDPQVDDPQLGTSAARVWAVDVIED